MSNGGGLGDPLGKVEDLGKQIGKVIVDEPKKSAKTTVVQVGLETQEKDELNANQNQALNAASNKAVQEKANEELIKTMYAKSDNLKTDSPTVQLALATAKKHPQETPEEIRKMVELRQKLHRETYFDPTFNPLKKQEEPRPAEQIEEEKKEKKQMEALELQKEEKKKEELAPSVKQGTVEKNPGISG
jgi:hypothetical protein